MDILWNIYQYIQVHREVFGISGPAMVAAIFAVVAVLLMWWWRPRTKLFLHPSRWKAHREYRGIYVIGHIDASTPNAMFVTKEVVLIITKPNGTKEVIRPDETEGHTLNTMEFGGYSQFVFRLPELESDSVLAEVRVVLADRTKGKLDTFRLVIPPKESN